jgi:hypothetical protein
MIDHSRSWEPSNLAFFTPVVGVPNMHDPTDPHPHATFWHARRSFLVLPYVLSHQVVLALLSAISFGQRRCLPDCNVINPPPPFF